MAHTFRRTMLTLALVAGCAAGRRDTVPHTPVAIGYADHNHLFAIELRDAAAATRSPSSSGHVVGSLGGSVCGNDIAYDAEYLGGFMTVTGYATNIHTQGDQMTQVSMIQRGSPCSQHADASGFFAGQSDSRPVQLELRDVVENGAPARRLRGAVGQTDSVSDGLLSAPVNGVDLAFSPQRLSGEVGMRRYEMQRRGDDLVGYFTMYGKKVPYIVHGADELWRMPPAAQAALLALLLTCTEETRMIQRIDFR